MFNPHVHPFLLVIHAIPSPLRLLRMVLKVSLPASSFRPPTSRPVLVGAVVVMGALVVIGAAVTTGVVTGMVTGALV